MIRPATEADIPAILVLGKSFFDQAGWPAVAEWDEESVARFLLALIHKHIDGELLVAEFDGAPIGMSAYICFPAYFNAHLKSAQELFWYIAPDYRVGAGVEMLKALEASAKARGAQLFIMGAVTTLRSEALSRLYKRRGYSEGERTFMKRLDR